MRSVFARRLCLFSYQTENKMVIKDSKILDYAFSQTAGKYDKERVEIDTVRLFLFLLYFVRRN